jgi:acetyltransferase-like isoleucine patch superfamily enzyme
MIGSSAFSVYAADVTINAGTLVYFKVKEAFDSDNYPRKNAGTVDFVVSRDVKIGQEVVIAKGTPAEAILLKNKNNFISIFIIIK